MTVHPLADRYYDGIYELPDDWRVRTGLEDEVARALTGGRHVAIRGFWRIGKTVLTRAVLAKACERSGGAAFFIDLRDPETEDGLPVSKAAVLARVAARTKAFLDKVGAKDVAVDPLKPLAVLGELAAPIFVGLDELIALNALPGTEMAETIAALMDVPRNVRLAVVCHRHRDVDATFEAAIFSRPDVDSCFLQPVSDEEILQLVNKPAEGLGVSFDQNALGTLAAVSGGRPWEIFSLLHLVANGLAPDFKGVIGSEAVEALMNLDVLTESGEGQALVDNYLRILVSAMSAPERQVVELVAAGGEGEAPEDAVQLLETYGWITTADGFAINGALFDGIARAVAQGEIKVSVE